MKCSGSRMAHLTLPERKRVKVMRKGGGGWGRGGSAEEEGGSKRGGAVAGGGGRQRNVQCKLPCKRMKASGGMEEHKHYSRGN